MLTFRELNQGDRSELCSLFHAVFTVEPWNEGWDNMSQLEKYISDIADNANSLCFGLFDDGKLIGSSLGTVMHWWAGTQYYIYEYFIRSDLQNNGYGSILFDHIKSALTKKQIRVIFLHTSKSMPAYKFYQKHGFTEISDHISLTFDF